MPLFTLVHSVCCIVPYLLGSGWCVCSHVWPVTSVRSPLAHLLCLSPLPEAQQSRNVLERATQSNVVRPPSPSVLWEVLVWRVTHCRQCVRHVWSGMLPDINQWQSSPWCVCVCVCVCVYITEDSSVNVWVSGFSLGLDGQAGHSVPCDGCFFFFFFYFFPLWRWSLWKDLLSVLTCGMCNPSCHSDGALPVIRRVSARRDRCEMFPHRISLTEAFLKGCDGGGPDASSSESKTQMCEPASHLDGNINTAAITITSQTFGPYKDWGITSVLIKALICQQMCEEQKITHDWFSCFESQWELLMCAYVYIKGISSTHSEQLSEQLAVDGCYKLLRGLNLLP